MKKTFLTLTAFAVVGSAAAQPYPRQERHIMDNNKRMTDANVSLFNVHSEYDFPYLIPTAEDITQKLLRIANFLEGATADAIVDAKTGEKVTDLRKIPTEIAIAPGDFRPYSYEWGVTYSGMMQAYKATGERAFDDYVTKRMELLAKVLPEVDKRVKKDKDYKSPFNMLVVPQVLDNTGAICAAMIRSANNKQMRPYIDRIMEFVYDGHHRLPDRTVARNSPHENILWLDDLYMSVPVLTEMYKLTGDTKYADDAVKQIVQFSDRMFVPSSGLYMHSWVEDMNPHPELYWGRANGWGTLAMCDLLDALPEHYPGRDKVLEYFQAHCAGLLRYQSGKGLWHQLLDRNDSYLESSATAMFVYGMAHGINKGWLDAKAFGPAALLGWNALSDQINNMGQIENVCVGTGVSYEPAYYYHRHVHPYTAHGYGPALMAGSEMIELLRNYDTKQSTAIYFFEKR